MKNASCLEDVRTLAREPRGPRTAEAAPAQDCGRLNARHFHCCGRPGGIVGAQSGAGDDDRSGARERRYLAARAASISGKMGVMPSVIGGAGGIGGFYLPVAMGIARENTGSCQLGSSPFGVVAALAFRRCRHVAPAMAHVGDTPGATLESRRADRARRTRPE